MMNNLFSIFDSSTSLNHNYNWISMLLNIQIIPVLYFYFTSKFFWIFKKFYIIIINELNIILSLKFNNLNCIYFSSLFLLILINNLFGLFPYIFSSSSHLIFSLSISIPLWISLIFFCLMKNLNFLLSHLIPQNTPLLLMPFMVIIETISNLIRPATLSIRLTANMIAGHLLLTLLSESLINSSWEGLIYLGLQLMLLILELSVSFIQSYVFMILSTLYLKETN